MEGSSLFFDLYFTDFPLILATGTAQMITTNQRGIEWGSEEGEKIVNDFFAHIG
jgi:hypothetical protein